MTFINEYILGSVRYVQEPARVAMGYLMPLSRELDASH